MENNDVQRRTRSLHDKIKQSTKYVNAQIAFCYCSTSKLRSFSLLHPSSQISLSLLSINICLLYILDYSFPCLMIVTIISLISIVGLAVSRFFHKTQREILDMFNQNEISSSISSNSLTSEHHCQSASLTFSLRWDENKQSLYVRILNARDLCIYKRHRQPSIIDSYVRIELRTIDDEQNSSDIYPSMRTPIIKQNPHPIYDELIEYPDLKSIFSESYSLILTVLTYDTFARDQILGQIAFPIQSDTLNSTEMIFTKTLTLRHEQVIQLTKIKYIFCRIFNVV